MGSSSTQVRLDLPKLSFVITMSSVSLNLNYLSVGSYVYLSVFPFSAFKLLVVLVSFTVVFPCHPMLSHLTRFKAC